MTRKSVSESVYPKDWREIASAVKEAAGWKCVRCEHPHDPSSGHTLTVHHADMNPGNSAWFNLLPLCQRCHLQIQHKVDLNRPWVMAEHSEWFKVFAAGFYAFKYLGVNLSRSEVEARLTELLELERTAVLGAPS